MTRLRCCALLLALLGLLPAARAADAQARLASGDRASEYWDLTAVFESGHRVFVRFSITNEGPGDRTAYAVGQVVLPDGAVFPFHNGRRSSRWKLSQDRRRMKIGSSVLDLGPAMHHFEVDKDGRGVKVFLDFDPRHDPLDWEEAPPGMDARLVALGAPVTGTIWIRERMQGQAPARVRGRVTLTQVFADEAEPTLWWRRAEVHWLAGAGAAAYLVDVAPADGAARGWLAARRPDGSWLSRSVSPRLSGIHPQSRDGYPLPRVIDLAGADASGRVEVGARILDHDPLELVPTLLRWLFTSRADPLHVWLESSGAVAWPSAEPALAVEGPGLVSVYFTNPRP